MENLLSKCNFPELPDKYDKALRQLVRFVLANYEVSGIIAAGTIIRGNPSPTSDLDVYVINKKPFRQRVQKYFDEVPAEIFINPPERIYDYFKIEKADGRPIAAHMLATGFVIFNVDPIVEKIRQEAQNLLNEKPDYSPQSLTISRYMAANLYEDAMDVAETDPATAIMLLAQAVFEMLKYLFKKSGRYIPRLKNILDEAEKIDEGFAVDIRKFYGSSAYSERLKLAKKIARVTIGVKGFFEWESQPE